MKTIRKGVYQEVITDKTGGEVIIIYNEHLLTISISYQATADRPKLHKDTICLEEPFTLHTYSDYITNLRRMYEPKPICLTNSSRNKQLKTA